MIQSEAGNPPDFKTKAAEKARRRTKTQARTMIPARKPLQDAPQQCEKHFFKLVKLPERDLLHPSLRAKKYDEALDRRQARVNKDWRLCFTIVDDTHIIVDIIPQPK